MNLKLCIITSIFVLATLVCRGEKTTNSSNAGRIFYHLTARDGLSGNSVLAITQDMRGFIWIGTPFGLTRYDGREMIHYTHQDGKATSLSSSSIKSLLTEKSGNMWVGTTEGLNYYDRHTDLFRRIYLNGYKEKFTVQNQINATLEDSQGRIWIGTAYGLFCKLNKNKMKFTRYLFGKKKTGNEFVNTLYEDHAKNIWIGTNNGLIKLYNKKSSKERSEFIIFRRNSTNNLTDNDISAIAQDSFNQLWVGTDLGGLNRLDEKNGKFVNLPSPTWSISDLMKDKQGQLWIAGPNQLTVLDTSSGKSTIYRHDSSNEHSLGSEHTLCLFEDRSGSVWAGTYSGGLSISHLSDTPFQSQKTCFANGDVVNAVTGDGGKGLLIGTELGMCIGGGNSKIDDGYSNSITGIKATIIAKDGSVWAGSSHTGLWQFKNGEVIGRFTKIPNDSNSLNSNYVLCLLEDSRQRIWVGTHKGLNLLNKNTGSFTHFSSNSRNEIAGYIHKLFEDSKHNLWIGTSQGLGLLRQGKKNFEWFPTVSRQSISSYWKSSVEDIFENKKGEIWIGTYGDGLKRYDPLKNSLIPFKIDGLPEDVINIIEDNKECLWLTSIYFLYKFDPISKKVRIYNFDDRIPGYEISERASYKNRSGELFFGTNLGLLRFKPEHISDNLNQPPLAFTSLNIFNVKPADSKKSSVSLKKRIDDAENLTLASWQDSFTIGFAVLNFIKPKKNQYAYKLEGIDNDWIYPHAPSATFNHLAPGEYTLLVKGANNDGIWNSVPLRMHITVLPPWWKTWWAYGLYVCTIFMILFLLARFLWLRATLGKEKELHRQKMDFFTNVSHEIRSHMMLISGPIEKLVRSEKVNRDVQRQLRNIQNNSARLSGLVKELMDFRKAETANMKLNVTQNDLIPFLKNIFTSFSQLAESRDIKSFFISDTEILNCWFDTEQFDKTIYNLLSNAYKFTPDHGHVILEIKSHAETITIMVTDNGKGIARENLKNVFVSYFQVYDPALHNIGHGLGLALAKSIIELHKGTLTVDSTQAMHEKAGSTTFTITLRQGNEHFSKWQMADYHDKEDLPDHLLDTTQIEKTGGEKYTVLLAENHDEFRNLVKDMLSGTYEVISCRDGKEAYNNAISQIPDIIVSDIVMPGLDGLELCKRIKTHEITSHIPIILLTAHDSQQYELKGFKNGANAYISKPFRLEILELKIRNLLSSRKAIQQKFSTRIFLEPGNEVVVNNKEEQFINNLLQFVEENMDNPQFSVTLLSKHMGMSEPVLYKKVRALLNMTVNDFVKTIRLKRAAKMLKTGMSPSEVSLSVGYSDQKYFSREFKKTFGVTPGKWINAPAKESRDQ